MLVKTLFWASAGGLAWTHVGYPLAAGALARVRVRRIAKDSLHEPSVSVIVAAHNEEPVIERRLENLLALDYPGNRLEIVVASDASTDRTNELVQAVADREPRVRLIHCPRCGKVAAQDRAVRDSATDVVAFSDANATWAPRTWGTYAAVSASRMPPGRTARACTGATSSGYASRNRDSAPSRGATARSMP